jgi:hypothetical protein
MVWTRIKLYILKTVGDVMAVPRLAGAEHSRLL